LPPPPWATFAPPETCDLCRQSCFGQENAPQSGGDLFLGGGGETVFSGQKNAPIPAKTFFSFFGEPVFSGQKYALNPAKTFFYGKRLFSGQKDSPIPA